MNTLEQGRDIIRQFALQLPETPGVYRMLGTADDVLYVGKARMLKRRVLSYTQTERLPHRLKRMVSLTNRMEFIHTETEVEALLLEQNLIKQMKPAFNILLKDDKAYPFILLSDHEFPRIAKHRGARVEKGKYYGPFASPSAVYKTVEQLTRAFQIRNCPDTVFAGRTRPCLQYHIKRCTAPCVNYVDKETYAEQVQQARDFLGGKSSAIKTKLMQQMEVAAESLQFEQAAKLRDRIKALASITLLQDIYVEGLGDADVLACAIDSARKMGCIQIFFFRNSHNFGNRAFYPKIEGDESAADILEAFVNSFYAEMVPPETILLAQDIEEKDLIAEALQLRHSLKKRPEISFPQRGDRVRVRDFVFENAQQALARHVAARTADHKNLEKLAEIFALGQMPERIEVYDNSHTGGTNMLAGMVVATPAGFKKAAYRKFNIREAEASDDFGMMREVMRRRFKNGLGDGGERPDLLLIDGGEGQLSSVYSVLDELGLSEDVAVVAISKGPDRNAGREWMHQRGQDPFQLPVDDAALHYLQRLRDEAHRFAIGTMRVKRQKVMVGSRLDEIAGIGPKRKKALLAHFGSPALVARAGLADLEAVAGIDKKTAKLVFDFYQS